MARDLNKTEAAELEPLLQRQEETAAWADVLQRRLLRQYGQPARYAVRQDCKFQTPDGEVVEGVEMSREDFDQMFDARDEKSYWDAEVQHKLVELKKVCGVPFGSQITINGWKWNGPDGQPLVKKEKAEAKTAKTQAARQVKKAKRPTGKGNNGASEKVVPIVPAAKNESPQA